MKIKNVSPLGELDVTLLRRVVGAGEVVDVPKEQAEALIEQGIFVAVDTNEKGK